MTPPPALLPFAEARAVVGDQLYVMASLATVVVGGLITSTLLTLLVLPAVYAGRRGSRIPAARVP